MNTTVRVNANDVMFNEVEECPMCHKALKPQIVHSALFNECEDENGFSVFTLTVLNICTACKRSFVAEYTVTADVINDDNDYEESQLNHVAPKFGYTELPVVFSFISRSFHHFAYGFGCGIISLMERGFLPSIMILEYRKSPALIAMKTPTV